MPIKTKLEFNADFRYKRRYNHIENIFIKSSIDQLDFEIWYVLAALTNIFHDDIKSTRDPKICLSCQTSLLNYYQFMTECLAKQENIMECEDREVIKLEELDIKTEDDEWDGNTDNSISLTYSNAIPSEDTEIKFFVDRSYEQETNHTSVNWDPNQNGNEIKLEYSKDHKLIEDVAVTRYHCPYVTKQNGLLSRHILIHRKSLEIRTYDCSLCPYKAKTKKPFNRAHAKSQRCFRNNNL
ncbi:hypothetical protein NQ318_010683 [Aromia moschata]|uniref:ZAD domain-containing protein n=1 Tax=Aromia moschata TaxID=1265417 RepID=A0AAV8XNJ8_9CUCU|nr:hypothetical protein NQ318_010683 [Aromia moschata]